MKVIRPRFEEPVRKPLLPKLRLARPRLPKLRLPRPRLPKIAPRALLLWSMRAVVLIALVVSGYLAWMTFNPQSEVGCGAGFNCEEVFSSRWSKWMGMPVAIPAVSLYAALLAALAFSGPSAPPRVRQAAFRGACCLAVLAAGAGIWFIALQSLVVGTYCPWCLAVHFCGIGAAALAAPLCWNARSTFLASLAAGGAGVALLVAGQWVTGDPSGRVAYEEVVNNSGAPPTRLEVGSLAAQGQASAPPVPAAPDGSSPSAASGENSQPPDWLDDLVADPADTSQPPAAAPTADPADVIGESDLDPPPAAHAGEDDLQLPGDPAPPRQRIISVLDRKAEIDVYQHPILGSPEARHVVVKLFDYTCPHCRVMHGHLQLARRRLGPDFAVVMLPVPMNSSCNHYVQRTDPKHLEACELAKLALAVWRADPAKFEAFDAWLFAPDHPPTALQARLKAAELVGDEALVRELDDWRLNDRLAVGVKLYQLAGLGVIPKVLVPPSGMIRGRVENSGDVLQFLQNGLGLSGLEPAGAASPIGEGEIVP